MHGPAEKDDISGKGAVLHKHILSRVLLDVLCFFLVRDIIIRQL